MERISPRTPETIQPLSVVEKAFLTDNVTGLRTEQSAILTDTSLNDDEKNTKLHDTISSYLEAAGIQSDDEEFANYFSTLRAFSADRMDDLHWRFGEWDEANQQNVGLTGQDELRAAQRNLFGRDVDIDSILLSGSDDTDADPGNLGEDEGDDNQRTERHEALKGELGGLRIQWARVSSKRLGSFTSFVLRKKERQRREALKAAYDAKVQELGAFELEGLLTDDEKTVIEKNTGVIEYLLEEQGKLRQETKEALKGTKVSKFIDWMNRGNVATRIAKGVGVGAAVGAVGAFTGGLVAGGAVIATGATIATRFAKGYASKDRHRGSKMEDTVSDTRKQELLTTIGDENIIELNAAHGHTDKLFEQDVTKEQGERLKALCFGLGAVALGGIAAYGVHEVAEHLSGANLTILGGDEVGAESEPVPLVPETPPTGGGGGGGVVGWDNFVPDAHHIQYGEGGFQTLEEMGVPADKLDSVWETAGQELNLHGDAGVYRMADGHWGWSAPGDMTQNDLQILVDAAKQNGVTLSAEG